MTSTFDLDAPYLPHTSCFLSVFTAWISLSHLNSDRNPGPRSTFLIIAIFTLVAFNTSQSFTDDRWLNFVFARYQLIFLAHQSWLHCILGFDALKEERAQWWQRRMGKVGKLGVQKSKNTCDDPDWLFGYKMLFNPMGVGMKWDVSRGKSRASVNATNMKKSQESIPRNSEEDSQRAEGLHTEDREKTEEVASKQSPPTIPSPTSRVSFIAQRIGVLFCRYIALCILYDPLIYFVMPGKAPITIEDYSPSRQYFFKLLLSPMFNPTLPITQYTSIISHALALRAHYLLEYLTREYLTLSSYHDILAIIFVAVGFDEPDEWPPLFGNIVQAYTVRRYWSEYWHLLIYRSFGGHISALLHRLGLSARPGMSKTWTRLLHNGLVFAASGLMHVMVLWAQTGGRCVKCGCWAPFWWFVMMIVGFVVETVLLAAAKSLAKSLLMGNGKVVKMLGGRGGSEAQGWVLRMVGYAWVAGWLTFTMEFVDYPDRYCGMGA